MQETRVKPPRYNWELHGQEDIPDAAYSIVGPMKVRGREVVFIGCMVTDEIKYADFICNHCEFIDVRDTHQLTDAKLPRLTDYMCPRSLCNSGLFISLPRFAIMRMEGELE